MTEKKDVKELIAKKNAEKVAESQGAKVETAKAEKVDTAQAAAIAGMKPGDIIPHTEQLAAKSMPPMDLLIQVGATPSNFVAKVNELKALAHVRNLFGSAHHTVMYYQVELQSYMKRYYWVAVHNSHLKLEGTKEAIAEQLAAKSPGTVVHVMKTDEHAAKDAEYMDLGSMELPATMLAKS
jgi:hypothetical protein